MYKKTAHLTSLLTAFKFPLQFTRENVMVGKQKSYRGFVLGKVNSWSHLGGSRGKEKILSLKTKLAKYNDIYRAACKLMKSHDPSFRFTSIQFNKNHKMKKHIDSKNVGVSYIIGLGDYEDGRLIIYSTNGKTKKFVNIKNKFFKFNGSVYPHETEKFKGNRYTLVYYKI